VRCGILAACQPFRNKPLLVCFKTQPLDQITKIFQAKFMENGSLDTPNLIT
jgi:hypothetical protein